MQILWIFSFYLFLSQHLPDSGENFSENLGLKAYQVSSILNWS